MSLMLRIQAEVAKAVADLYAAPTAAEAVNLAPTRKGIEGDYTVVVFPFTKVARKKPDDVAQEIGQHLVNTVDLIVGFNVVKGFLNLTIRQRYWVDLLNEIAHTPQYGYGKPKNSRVLVEFSSPNTNKPLHLGHIRNNLLGWSVSKILQAAGYEVFRVQVINDRGIHICKSMYAWQYFGNGENPTTANLKSDHLVGKYYVFFEKKFQEEYKHWQTTSLASELYKKWLLSEGGLRAQKEESTNDLATYFFKTVYKNLYFNEYSAIGKSVKEMLMRWEEGEPAVRELWEMMNGWVYAGFEETYRRLGVSFDRNYYESQTYLLGKSAVEAGLERGVFYRREDGSVWCDLRPNGLDEKLVLRSNGTSVYMTQDLGTAQQRYADFGAEKMVYVVGDEQEYHFKVLFEMLKRLGEPFADGLFHLSYGMVELPTGKMKSREGKVVDADDLMDEVIAEAQKASQERGTLTDTEDSEQREIFRRVGMSALKYFILKVNPKKKMIFDPTESVDLHGQTGPYIQYAVVRTRSLLRKAGNTVATPEELENYQAHPAEKELLLELQQFEQLIQTAAAQYDPSLIANYCYNLAKAFNKYYHDFPILKPEVAAHERAFRLQLAQAIGKTLSTALDLLGIEIPEYM